MQQPFYKQTSLQYTEFKSHSQKRNWQSAAVKTTPKWL